ncbi:MAG TPA: hydrogenase maturation protease [Terriglobales bacterium]|nr:hydrogenase maturation protease [Terriglobales bacterium]
MTFQVIGCGNLDRGDDAAGLLVARRLRQLGVPAQEQSGEAFVLMESLASAEKVVLVDAVAAEGEPGAVQVWNANLVPLPRESFCCSTHAFGVREAVELARILGRLPLTLIVYGIAGRNFQMNASLSPEVAGAVERAAQRIAADFFGAAPTKNAFAGAVKEII